MPISTPHIVIESKYSYLLDVVVAQGTAILKLLASEDQTLLVGGDALLILDLALNVVDGIAGLDLEGDGLAGDYQRRWLARWFLKVALAETRG